MNAYRECHLQRITQIFCDTVYANTAHRSHCECTNKRVGILGILQNCKLICDVKKVGWDHLDKGIHSQDCEFGFRFRIVYQVQVNELLQFETGGLHTLQDIREKARHVFPYCHCRDHFVRGSEQ